MIASERSLLRAWAMLMALSAALAIATEVARPSRFHLVWAGVVALVAYLKARIVLANYLGLKSAPGALAGFAAAIGAIFLLVVLSFALEQALAALK